MLVNTTCQMLIKHEQLARFASTCQYSVTIYTGCSIFVKRPAHNNASYYSISELICRSLDFTPTQADHGSDYDELENNPISTPLRMNSSGTPSTSQSVRRYIDGLNTPSRSIIKVNYAKKLDN